MTKFNILLVLGLFLGMILFASSIQIYNPIIQYILFIVVITTLLLMINFILNPID